jgi:hypothetical protein
LTSIYTNISLTPVREVPVPVRWEVLIAPARGVSGVLSKQLRIKLTEAREAGGILKDSRFEGHESRHTAYLQSEKSTIKNRPALSPSNLAFAHIRDLYPHFEYSDIGSHPAMIVLPYQVSSGIYIYVYIYIC